MGACCGAAENKSLSTLSPNKGKGPSGGEEIVRLEPFISDLDDKSQLDKIPDQTKNDVTK